MEPLTLAAAAIGVVDVVERAERDPYGNGVRKKAQACPALVPYSPLANR